MQMETALYYTLSTVSQTIAGALGMLAAFLALRVSALDADFNAAARELERSTGQWGIQARYGKPADIINHWTHFLADSSASKNAVLDTARRAHTGRRMLLLAARRVFVVSACVMSACFVGLASAPVLCHSLAVSVVALAVAILGGIRCLFSYARIVRDALE